MKIEELYPTDGEIHKLIDHWNPLPTRLDGLLPKELEFRLFQGVAKFAVENCIKKIEKDTKNPFVGYIDVVENIRMAKEQGFERFREYLKELIK